MHFYADAHNKNSIDEITTKKLYACELKYYFHFKGIFKTNSNQVVFLMFSLALCVITVQIYSFEVKNSRNGLVEKGIKEC